MQVHTWNEVEKQHLCLRCWTLARSISTQTLSFLASLRYQLIPSLSYSLPFCLFLFSADCKPVGGLIEDAFLWGTKVILFRHYVSLSKADTLLKKYSPHWVPRLPTERLWKGLKGIGDTGRLPLSSHHCTTSWEAGVKSFIRSGRRCLQSPR